MAPKGEGNGQVGSNNINKNQNPIAGPTKDARYNNLTKMLALVENLERVCEEYSDMSILENLETNRSKQPSSKRPSIGFKTM